jgi:ankyrin repeat protein
MVKIVPFYCSHSDEYIDDLPNKFEYDDHGNPLSLELQNAVILNDIRKVEELLKTGKNINEKDEHGRTALHYASLLLLPNIVELLLNNKANIDDQDETGLTPLMLACTDYELIHQYGRMDVPYFSYISFDPSIYHLKSVLEEAQSCYSTENYMKVFKMLIEKNPDVNKMNKYELRALHYASNNYYTVEEQIDLLIKHGAQVNAADKVKATALFYVKKGAIALSLIKNQADVNARNKNGDTPLHHVRSDKVASILIKSKADINAINSYGVTPLHEIEDPRVIRLLLLSKADVNKITLTGHSALYLASMSGLTRKVDYLLLNGANVNVTDILMFTPLHHAANPEIIDLLVQHGADVNAKDSMGNTPLMTASNVKNEDALIRHGANVNISNNLGKTKLHIAAELNNKDVASYLIYHGSYINAKDKDGNTPLHMASRIDIYQNSSYGMVKLLLDAGAEVNAQNNEKETPLHLAAKYGQAETLILLLAHKADFSLKNSNGLIAFETMQTKSDRKSVV